MWLQMYLGGILIEEYELLYEGITSYAERDKYQKRLRDQLLANHAHLVYVSKVQPKFSIAGQRSQADNIEISNRCIAADDDEFLQMMRQEFKNEPWSKTNLKKAI